MLEAFFDGWAIIWCFLTLIMWVCTIGVIFDDADAIFGWMVGLPLAAGIFALLINIPMFFGYIYFDWLSGRVG